MAASLYETNFNWWQHSSPDVHLRPGEAVIKWNIKLTALNSNFARGLDFKTALTALLNKWL